MKSSNKAKLFAAAALFLIASVSLCLLVSCGGAEAKPDESKQEIKDVSNEKSKDASEEDSKEESSLEGDNSADGMLCVLETYREYLKNVHYTESAPYLHIQQYVGTFGDGCIVAYMDGDYVEYTDGERTETYGSHTITFSSGKICHAFYNGETLTIGQAYERGILSDDDILVIDTAVGVHVRQPGE